MITERRQETHQEMR